jgi:hypothetical protein
MTVVVAALLLPLPAVATAKGDHSKGASKSRQAERLRQTEQKRLQALVDADVAVAGTLIANDFGSINPLGEVLTRDDLLGGVGSGALDFLSDTVTSRIKVRGARNMAVVRYQHTIDIAVAGIGHLTHPAGPPPSTSGARATGRSSGADGGDRTAAIAELTTTSNTRRTQRVISVAALSLCRATRGPSRVSWWRHCEGRGLAR